MNKSLDLDELLNTAIIGPWVQHNHRIGDPNLAAAAPPLRQQFIYPTLAHWIEASKVLPSRMDLLESIVFSPTIKEAQRVTRMNKAACRTDWNLISHSVFTRALATLCLQRPQFDLPNANPDHIVKALEETQLSPSFISTCLIRFAQWTKGPRVSFIGADLAPEDVVGKRASKTVPNVGIWTLLSTCNGRTSWRLHDWALAHYVPIEYVGSPDDRMSRRIYQSLISKSTHVVVFEKRGDRRHDTPLRMAKEADVKLNLELFDVQRVNNDLFGS